jgi:hypothetical protein
VGASLGLSYSDQAAEHGDGLFHNVYLDPRAYDEYKRTGTFPERTMLAMTVYRGSTRSTGPSSSASRARSAARRRAGAPAVRVSEDCLAGASCYPRPGRERPGYALMLHNSPDPRPLKRCRNALIALGMAALAGCGKPPPKPPPAPLDVSIMTIEARDVPVSTDFVAQTQSSQAVNIQARVSGFLDRRV